MPTVDVRKYGETMRDQGKSSLDEMRKLVRAWLGATDLAYHKMRAELKDLEVKNRSHVEKLQARAKKLNREDVRKQVREAYDDFARHGEEVIEQLRARPQTRLVFKRTERFMKTAEQKVEQAEQKVEEAERRVVGNAAKKAAGPKASAGK